MCHGQHGFRQVNADDRALRPDHLAGEQSAGTPFDPRSSTRGQDAPVHLQPGGGLMNAMVRLKNRSHLSQPRGDAVPILRCASMTAPGVCPGMCRPLSRYAIVILRSKEKTLSGRLFPAC